MVKPTKDEVERFMARAASDPEYPEVLTFDAAEKLMEQLSQQDIARGGK